MFDIFRFFEVPEITTEGAMETVITHLNIGLSNANRALAHKRDAFLRRLMRAHRLLTAKESHDFKVAFLLVVRFLVGSAVRISAEIARLEAEIANCEVAKEALKDSDIDPAWRIVDANNRQACCSMPVNSDIDTSIMPSTYSPYFHFFAALVAIRRGAK